MERRLKNTVKRINEVFSDYKASGNINNAIVESVVLIKKSKRLELTISSDKYIEIREFEGLNRFIRKRFALEDSIITVKYTDGTEKKPIEEALDNIVLSLADKYPVLKTALNNCEYKVDKNTINFNFKIAVSGFLKKMNYDERLQTAIKNLYGAVYNINFVDKVSGEETALQNEDDDLLRPLTQEGTEDSKKVTEFLLNKNIDKVFSYNNFNICLKILCNSNSYRI